MKSGVPIWGRGSRSAGAVGASGRRVGLGVALAAVMGSSLGLATRAASAPRIELRPGDHICIVGNTLADRMQHSGWLESLIHTRFPQHELVVRNLGFAGDELTVRLRSEGFGSPDDWLKRTQADVVFAFFGSRTTHSSRLGKADG
ncbi:MAG: hypothetical protein FJ387_10905 [Verrucomicrobia bacterium]|nr:hypothetical protein [Verrucomicrobiota bacterium]